jgi:hypothetical protein
LSSNSSSAIAIAAATASAACATFREIILRNWYLSPFCMVETCDCPLVPTGPSCDLRPPHASHYHWHEHGRLNLRLVGQHSVSGRTWASSPVLRCVAPNLIETDSYVSFEFGSTCSLSCVICS